MRKAMMRVLALVALLIQLEPVMTGPTVAAPAALEETGVYEEDFTAYTFKDYVENAEWDIWTQTLRLARPDAVSQDCPAVTTDGSGNIIVVWEDYGNGDGDIYAQRLDVSGNRLWAAGVRVNSDSGMAPQEYPSVAADGDGNAVVVWRDDRTGNGDIYAQKLDASGNKLWTTDVRVNSDSGTTWQWSPTVVVDRSGNAVVVWEDHRNGNVDIYAQKLNGSGNRLWVTDVCVNSDNGTAGQWSPAAALDGSGNAVVVWYDYRNGDSDIYAQKLNGSGNRLWVADVCVNSDDGTAGQRSPSIAVDGSGSAIVVWSDDRNGDRNRDIYAQNLDGSGDKLWAADVRVNSDSGTADQWSPTVSADGSGHAVVVWGDQRSDGGDIYAQKLERSGSRLWASDVRVNSDSGEAQQRSPAATVDSNGNTIAVWQDRRDDNDDIYAQKLDTSGGKLWTADVEVASDGGATYQDEAATAVDESGNAVVVWEDRRSSHQGIYVQRLDATGNRLWAADVRVNSISGTIYQGYPAIAIDRGGKAIVVWSDRRNDYGDIYAQRLDGSGNKLWVAEVRVNSDSGTTSQWCPAVAVDGNGNAIVVWQDSRGSGDIYAQKLDADGNKLWTTDVRVNSDSGTAWQWFPTVAARGNGNAIVAWEDFRSGSSDIYAQKLNAGGDKLWTSDVRVNSDSGTASHEFPAVVVDGSADAVIVWHDDRNGSGDNGDIWAQKLDGTGNRMWVADVRVDSDSGTASQWHPDVAVDEAENLYIVWEDSRDRNGDVDIYAQKIDGQGNKSWAFDVRVNSDSGRAWQEHPSVAVDGSGNAVCVWEDYRNGNADVYIQRINTVGGKGWLADLQVVYPDRFYYPTGTAQSRTVDTMAGGLAQARLTADYQSNSGKVQFYLTNDGGAHWVQVTPGVMHVFATTGSDLRWRAAFFADPVWQRTPIVNSLRVEYSTQAPYADGYEPDGTCAQASSLQVNGAAQAHTFHQYADGDWTWFEAVAGTTYIVQAVHTGSRADLELSICGACGQPSLPPDDEDTFGNDARLVFTAPIAGVYYVKAVNHDPAVYGEHTGYLLSVRTQSPAPVVAIVAGRNDRDELEPNITYMGDRAYRTFRRAGVPRENIRYLSIGVNRDTDQDGHLDVDGAPTWQNVRYAVQDWPRERGVRLGVPFYLYLVDHGGTDYYCAQGCAADRRVTAADLNLWLDNLEATSGADEINVVIEACFSGSFIDMTVYGPAEVSDLGRVVIASTGSRARAFPSERGGYFSDAFFVALGDNADLWTAYEAGRTAAQAAWGEQMPWLDDNGDAVADGRDGLIARGRGLASFGGGAIPVVDWLEVGEVRESGLATITAQVRDDVAVMAVTVEVYPPGLTVPETGEGETPVLPVERVVLQDGDHDGVYAGTHTGFTEEGVYRLVAYAWDNDGNLSLPRQTTTGERKVFLPLVMRND